MNSISFPVKLLSHYCGGYPYPYYHDQHVSANFIITHRILDDPRYQWIELLQTVEMTPHLMIDGEHFKYRTSRYDSQHADSIQ